MRAVCLLFALAAAIAQQQPSSPEQTQQLRQQAEAAARKYEQQAIAMNDAAGHIRSENEARVLVDSVAEMLGDALPPAWLTDQARRRVAAAEYKAVNGGLIPEQRVADVWNEFVHEIGGPEEALVSTGEIHNLRDADYASGTLMWSRGWNRSIWTAPNIYALDANGKVAEGCRALEALRILHDRDDTIQNVRNTRMRMAKGIVVSERLSNADKTQASGLDKTPTARLMPGVGPPREEPVHAAEQRYLKEHGVIGMNLMLAQLFDRFLPE